MTFLWNRKPRPSKKSMMVKPRPEISGYQFMLKGSPRHYDDVEMIIEGDGGATVYFGEALTYERGAGVAQWRVKAKSLAWLPRLYDWWAEAERMEPINFTFHLYHPENLRYPLMDLSQHTPEEVATFIAENMPWVGNEPVTAKPIKMSSGEPTMDSH